MNCVRQKTPCRKIERLVNVLFMKKHYVLTLLLLCALGVLTCLLSMPLLADAAPKVTIEWLIKPQFDMANDFACGVAWVEEEEKGKDAWLQTKRKWKQIDQKGNVLIDNYVADRIFSYDQETKLASFSNSQRLRGYMDLTGEAVVPPQYRFVTHFKEGLASVGQKSGDETFEGVIDRHGKTILPIVYESLSIVNHNLFVVRQGEKWGYVDSKGDAITDFLFDVDFVVPIDLPGVFAAQLNGKVGLLDLKGEWVLPAVYDGLHEGREGLIGLEKDGKVGFVDATGKTVLDFRFEGMSGWDGQSYYTFSEGLATVLLTKLPPFLPEKITAASIAAGTAFGFKMEDVRSGVIGKSGNLLFEFRGMPWSLFTGGLLVVQSSDDTYGVIDRDGKLYPLPKNVELVSSAGLSERILRVKVREGLGLRARDKYGYLKINVK